LSLGTTTAVTYSDTGLAAGTTYTYAVAAFDSAGNISAPTAGAVETTLALSQGTYATAFPLNENPIFENGNWTNGKTNGLDWANVQAVGGIAFGTQSGSGGYDDSTAILTGTWGPNQTAKATVHSQNQTGAVYEEVELRLRSSISAHSITGYEINFRCLNGGGYTQIVRWNGALGSFTYVNQNGNGNYHGIKDGDVVSASIAGNLIIAYVNGIEVIRGSDSTYSTGNPGMGFFLQGGTSGLNGDFGFSSFSATDGSAADTQAPAVPANLTATAVSPSQIDLAWTVSTDNVGVAGYQIYRNGVGVGSTDAATYSDTGLNASTSYTYAVAAFDTAGNISAPSTAANATTPAPELIPPSVPTNLQSLNVSSNSATVTWSASTDNVAVAGYQVFRNGTVVATTALTSYTDNGLAASTTYAYAVAAYDTSNNVSGLCAPLSVTTTAASSAPPSFVQVNNNQIASGTSTSVAFRSATQAGNAIVVYVIWSNTGNVTLTDTRGDTFISAASPVSWGSNYRAQVFYATNITGGAATVTASFQTAVNAFGVVYIHEYAGINSLSPIDITASASGSSAAMSSGAVFTTDADDLLFGAGVSGNSVTAAGSGFNSRTTAYGNITEDRTPAATGLFSATASQNGSTWGMQIVAFRPAN
jgi:chitodextrinase